MSRRNKLQKFAELQQFDNVYENFTTDKPQLVKHGKEPVEMRGKWHADHFGNTAPITLELGCGKGDYTVALARHYPDRNFIGVDVKGARMWKGATLANDEQLANTAFLRTRIECIDAFFTQGEVAEIWITFPDPFPRESKENRRLTSPGFLKRYRSILVDGGLQHLKTDDDGLYAYTRAVLIDAPDIAVMHDSADIYSEALVSPDLAIKTFYEKQHLAAGKTIKYLCWKYV